MNFTASEVAQRIDGRLFGKDLRLKGISSVQSPKEGPIIFYPSPKDFEKVKEKREITVVVSQKVNHESYILVEDVKLSLAKFLDLYFKEEHPSGIPPKAYVEESAVIGKDVYVGPFAYVGKHVV